MKTPEEIYGSIDRNEVLDDLKLAKMFREAGKLYEELGDFEKQEECLWDWSVTQLRTYEGNQCEPYKGKPFSPIWVGADGYISPDPDGIPENGLGYFGRRIGITQNTFLLARYNDYLWYRWRGRDNSHFFARKSYDYYTQLGASLFEKGKFYHGYPYYFRTIYLAKTLRDKQLLEKTLQTFLGIIDIINDHGEFRWIIEAVNCLLEHKRNLSNEDIQLLLAKVEFSTNGYKDLIGNEGFSYHIQRELYKRLKKIKGLVGSEAECVGIDVKIGESFEGEARCKTDDYTKNLIAGSYFLEQAYRAFKKIRGYENKAADLLIELKELNKRASSNIQVIRESEEIPQEIIDAMFNPIEDSSVNDIILGLIFDDSYLRDYREALEYASSNADRYFFSSILPRILYDNQGNIVYETRSKNDIIEFDTITHDLINHYRNWINVYYRQVIYIAMDKGMDIRSLLNQFRESSVISRVRIPIIEVALIRFFDHDYISFIHIAVFQIEGIIRDILKIYGIPTAKLNRERFYQERSFREVLSEPIMKKLLGDYLYPFIRFTLCDVRGHNIRNYLAHGLLTPEYFNEYYATIIFLILLKLCRFQIKRLPRIRRKRNLNMVDRTRRLKRSKLTNLQIRRRQKRKFR